MIKGFGIASFFVFLGFCSQVGSFGPGPAVWIISFLLVASGTLAYGLILFPKSFEEDGLKKLSAFKTVNPHQLIKVIEEIANVVRKDGLLATESLRRDLKDPWLKYALKKMIDGFEKSIIVHSIRNEHLRYHEQFLNLEKYKIKVFSTMSVVGLAGSLSHVMSFLSHDDPSLIAASFVPFLLSILLQIVMGAWYQNKVDFLIDQSRLYYAILENGVSGIQDGTNSEVLRDQLAVRLNEKLVWNDS